MKNRQISFLQVLINVLIWGFIILLPWLVFKRNNTSYTDFEVILNHSINILAAAIVFYVNYFLLTEKYLLNKKTIKFIGLNILLVSVLGALMVFFKTYREPLLPGFSERFGDYARLARIVLVYFRESGFMVFVAGLSIIIKLVSKWYITEAQRQEEEKRRKEAELLNLRQQINPHFFFNTLNNIYALIAISPDQAQQTVLELSKLMRYVLYDNNNNYVPINKEIDFLKNYVELMRIRLTSDVDVRTDIQVSPSSDKLIAPMLPIALIENAFKHGVSYSNKSFIHIDIHQVEDDMVFLIRNSYFPKDESDRSGSGIGIENLRRRLEILYPNQYTFTVQHDENVYVSELIIPLKENRKYFNPNNGR